MGGLGGIQWLLTERQPPDWEVVVSGVEGREEEAGLPLVPEGKQNTAQNQMLVKSTTLNVTLGIVFGVRGAIFGGIHWPSACRHFHRGYLWSPNQNPRELPDLSDLSHLCSLQK